MIKEFKKEYKFLSNFYPVDIELHGKVYSSVEHAYMSCKSYSEEWKDFCSDKKNSAGYVKKESKKIKLIENWEFIKLSIMETCLRNKFKNPELARKLLYTNNEFIQEGNYWGDKFWGVCLKTNQGENNLGKLIMKIRNELRFSLSHYDKIKLLLFDIENLLSSPLDEEKSKEILKNISYELNSYSTNKTRSLTSFQVWLGSQYKDLPTDSTNVTIRALKYLKETNKFNI